MERFWEIMAEECLFLGIVYGVEIHALVLMPNHFHLLVTAPAEDLGVAMNEFLKSLSRRSNYLSGRSGHVFGGPYHWSLIRDSVYFAHALKYVYRNPVRANLCTLVEEYPYSTLHRQWGHAHLPFPLHYTRTALDFGLPDVSSPQYLDWLNQPFKGETESLIRKGLRRRIFEKVRDRNTRLELK